MPVLLACPTCLQKIRAPETVLGKQIRCPQCKNPFTAVDSAAPPAARASEARQGGSAAPGTAVVDVSAAESASKSWSSAELAVDEDEFSPRSALRPLPAGGSAFADFLLLKTAIAPKIAVFLFYAGLVATLVFGLVCFVAAVCLILTEGLQRTLGLLLLVATMLGTPMAVIVWRVFCEMVAAVFRMQAERTKSANGAL